MAAPSGRNHPTLCPLVPDLRYSLSYRDLEEIMVERGLQIDHTTIYRWVQKFAPELEKRAKPHLKPTNDSWRTDETYIKIKKVWTYLYRAVDSEGNTLEFMLSTTRDSGAATRFFRKALGTVHTLTPRVITVDKNPAYPKALSTLKASHLVPESCELRQAKFLNNIVEQEALGLGTMGMTMAYCPSDVSILFQLTSSVGGWVRVCITTQYCSVFSFNPASCSGVASGATISNFTPPAIIYINSENDT